MRDERCIGEAPGPGVASRAFTSVRERDLDNFMLEELQTCEVFRTWFLAHLSHCFEAPPDVSVLVGKNPEREAEIGQTDLQLSFVGSKGEQVALVLIEDKLADGFQSNQPERYVSQREAARKRLGTRRAATVIVAPSSNQQVLDHCAFDASIRIEDITAHLRGRVDGESSLSGNPASIELRARLLSRIDLLETLAGKRACGSSSLNPVSERVEFLERIGGSLPKWRLI